MMDNEWKFRHKEELESNCQKLHALLKSGSSDWQIGWNKGINDIFNGTYTIRSTVDRLNALNLLLKVAEVAFKERTYRIRIEAYVCWRHFISTVEKYGTNGYTKLLKMLLVPLSASNHSQIDVLRAKLQTWLTMVETPFIQEASICDSAASHLLKILYGPHALKTASTVPDLTEDCAVLFKKMWSKCEHTDANERLVEYIPFVITSLTENQQLYELAEEIWCKVLDNVKANGWPDVHSKHLISTFKNLIRSEGEHSHKLIVRLLTNLIEKHGGFPARLLNDFYVMELNEQTDFSGQNISNIRSYWTTAIDYVSDHKLITKVVAAENLTWILILPIKFLYDELDDVIVSKMRSFHETLCRKLNHVDFIKLLMRNLTDLLHHSRASLSFLNATVRLCKIIALAPEKMKKKVSAATIAGMREVLLEINAKIKLLSNRIVKDDESFVASYVACILLFMRECPQFETDFIPLLRDYNLSTSDKDCKELPVAQLMNKYIGYKLVEPDRTSKSRSHNRSDDTSSTLTSSLVTTITPSTPCNKSSPMLKLSSVTKSQASLRSTPRSQKCEKDDESVEFIAIQPKVKQSPMTEHQKETIKTKNFIPALYQDLSQSQSNSLIDSVSLLPDATTTSMLNATAIRCGGTNFLEEDANLSPPSEKDELKRTQGETSEIIAVTQPFKFDVSACKRINTLDATDDRISPHSSEAEARSITVDCANIENICITTVGAEMSVDESTKIEKSSVVKRRSERLLNKSSTESSQPKRRKGRPRKSDNSNLVEVASVVVVEQNHDEENEKKQKTNCKSTSKKQLLLAYSKNETSEEMEVEETQEPIKEHSESGEPIKSSMMEVDPVLSESAIRDVTNWEKVESKRPDINRTDSCIVPRTTEEVDSSVLIVENNAPEIISIVDSDNQPITLDTPQNEDDQKNNVPNNESKDEFPSECAAVASEEKTNKSFQKNENEASMSDESNGSIVRSQNNGSSRPKRNKTLKKLQVSPSESAVLSAYSNHRFRGIMTKLAGNENEKNAQSKYKKPFSNPNICHSKPSNRPMSERTMNILTASVGISQDCSNESQKIQENEGPVGEKMKLTFERVLMKCPSSSEITNETNTSTPKMMDLTNRVINTNKFQEESYQNCTFDEPSDDMIADDEATSQDILYTPLQNCQDEIDVIVQKLNMQNVAVDLFNRMGIICVGDLASMSTIAAKSIPAGDNRVRRLRDALKKYKEECCSDGSPTTVARERNTDKCSSLVELLDEIEKTSQEAHQFETSNKTKQSCIPISVPNIVLEKLTDEKYASILNRTTKSEELSRLDELRPQDEQTNTQNIADKTSLPIFSANDVSKLAENSVENREKPREKNEVTDETVAMTTKMENKDEPTKQEKDEQLTNEYASFPSAVHSDDEEMKSRAQAVSFEVLLKKTDDVDTTNRIEDNFSPEIIETAEPNENHHENQSVQKRDETDLKYCKKSLGSKLQNIFWISVSQLAIKRLALENGEKTFDNGIEDVVEMVIKVLKELADSSEKGYMIKKDQKRDLASLCKMIFDKCNNET